MTPLPIPHSRPRAWSLLVALSAVLLSTSCSKNINAGGADVCTDGEFRCEGNLLKRCNPNRTGYDTADTCATATACDQNAGVCTGGGADGGAGGGTVCKFDDPGSTFDNCTFGP